jgi:hypothetical protein
MKQSGGRRLKLAQKPSGHYMYYKDTESDSFHGFKPLQLNAAMVQYLCNTPGTLSFSKSKDATDTSLYLGFNNFPSIVETIETKKKISKSVKDDEGNRDFTEVIEGNTPILDRDTNYKNLMESSQFKIKLEKIKYEQDPTKNANKEEAVITQDVEYVKKLIQDLSRILQSQTQTPRKTVRQTVRQTPRQTVRQTPRQTEICDLSYSTSDFLIVDRKRDYPGLNGEVVIVGYPGEINPFLKLKVPNPANPSQKILLIDLLKKTIFQEHKKPETEPGNYCQLLIQLRNAFKLNDADKINPDDSNEYYNFIKWNLNANFKYVRNILIQNPSIFPNGETDYLLLEETVNQLLKKLLIGIFTRPNTKIRYVFHPFIINPAGKIEPLIYNVRELEPKHKPVLERILELIQTEIPKRFEIFTASEMSKIRGGENVKFTNFYSYYRYGDIFHIKTEYLFPSTNMDQYTHVYNRSINLEELIYSSGLVVSGYPFWLKLNFQYEIRNYRFHQQSLIELNQTQSAGRPKTKKSRFFATPYSKKVENKTEKKYSPKFTFLDNSSVNQELNQKLKIKKILFIRENQNSTYEIYYQAENNKFYYLVLTPVLNNRDIFLPGLCTPITPHQKVFDCFNNTVNVYSVSTPVFKVEKLQEITPDLDKNKVNIFSHSWYFPLLRRIVNYTGLEKIPFLQRVIDYIPYTAFNTLNAKTYKEAPIDVDGTIKDKNKPKNCALDICEYFEYNGKIEFMVDGKSYVLIINKHTSDNNLIRSVVWLFNSSDTLNQLSPDRFKTISDLNNSKLIEEIIRQLILNGFYNPKTMHFGFNNFLSIDMGSLHFQIFPKSESTYYSSFIQSNNYISLEKRMENFINAYYKIKLYPNYYKDYKVVVFTPLKFNNL